MTACAKCGHDPEARVTARWEFVVEKSVSGLNSHSINAGAARFGYAKERGEWTSWFRAHRAALGIERASSSGKRRVTLTRLIGKGGRVMDRDNLIGGLKPAVDAMVREELLVDDKAAFAEIHYAQERAADGKHGLRILLEVLA